MITKELRVSIIAVVGNRIKYELVGVRNSFLTPVFEALKVRDPRLEPVSFYSYYEDIRKDLE